MLKELAADLVGDYLFTDTEFINNLSTNHRNVFQKVYDEVKYLCKVAKAGSKEARQLEKVKKAFEQAYRADNKAQKNTADGGVKYNLSDIEIERNYIDYSDIKGANVSIDNKVSDLVERGKVVPLSGESITNYENSTDWADKKAARQLLTEILEPNLGVSVVFEHDNQGATAYLTRRGIEHSVGGPASPTKAAAFEKFSSLIKNSEYAFSSENDPHSDSNKKISGDIIWDTFVAVGTVNGKPYPVTFKIRSIDQDVRSQIYEMATKKETGFSHGDGTQENPANAHPAYGTSPISGDNVAQEPPVVKGQLSLSDRNDIAPLPGDIYGKDIALPSALEDIAPVREDIAQPIFAAQSENDGIRNQLRSSQDALNAMNPVAEIQVSEDYAQLDVAEKKNWVVEKLGWTGYRVMRKGFGVIEFAKKRLKSAFNYFDKGSIEEAAFGALPYVLESGEEISSHTQHKGRDYGTVTIAAPITINGMRGNMAVVVKQTTGNYYKVHRILSPDGSVFVLPEMQIEAESTPTGESPINGSLATSKDSASNPIVPNTGENVNGDSSAKEFTSVVDIAPTAVTEKNTATQPVSHAENIAPSREQFESSVDAPIDDTPMSDGYRESVGAAPAGVDTAPIREDIAPVGGNITEKTTDTHPVELVETYEIRNKKGAVDGKQAFMPDAGVTEPLTRKALHQSIVDSVKTRFAEKGLDFDKVLKNAENLSTFATVDNTPQRVMEKALGYKPRL